MKNQLLVYTRTPLDSAVYSEKLAYSMHLALDTGDGFHALNHNYGVLFAKAKENENGTLDAMCLDLPYIFRLHGGGFGVLAVRVHPENGAAVPDKSSRGSVLVFTTDNLVEYEHKHPLLLSDSTITNVSCEPDKNGVTYTVRWRDGYGCHEGVTDDFTAVRGAHEIETDIFTAARIDVSSIEGARPRNTVTLTDSEADYVYRKLTTPHNTAIDIPADVEAKSPDDLYNIRVTSHYSDGTTAQKRLRRRRRQKHDLGLRRSVSTSMTRTTSTSRVPARTRCTGASTATGTSSPSPTTAPIPASGTGRVTITSSPPAPRPG